MRTAELISFMLARDARRKARNFTRKVSVNTRGASTPLHDPILDTYRFCNVRRNDDRVTVWLHKHWLERWRNHRDGWFAFAVARCAINRVDTMDAIEPYVLPFRPDDMRAVLKARRANGKTIYGAAYMIGTQGNAGDKIDFLIDKVLTPLWEDRKAWPGREGWLAGCHEWLVSHYAVGSFTGAQVLADWKYAYPSEWSDFDTFAASGPGSRKGLNRVMGYPVEQAWREDKFRATLAELRSAVLPLLRSNKDLRNLTAQDLQNCLCEFEKYERTRLGEGTPKQLYTPNREPVG